MDERIKKVVDSSYTIPVGVGILAFAAGVGVGYFLRGRESVVIVEAEDEGETNVIDKNQLSFDLDAPDILSASESVTKEPVKILEVVRDPEPEPEPEEILERVSVFKNPEDDWDYEEEEAKRAGSNIYVLHRDEFYADERDYDQSTLCYYVGDDILCDENDVPVYNYKELTGELEFGRGSTDPNVVHIRNESMEAEYEILKYDGHFSVEILGLDVEEEYEQKELKHSLHKFPKDY